MTVQPPAAEILAAVDLGDQPAAGVRLMTDRSAVERVKAKLLDMVKEREEA